MLLFGDERYAILNHLPGSDAMSLVISHLLCPTAIRLIYRLAHTVGNLVRVENHFPVYVPGCSPSRLRQGAM